MSELVKHNQSAEDYLESILLLSGQSEEVHRINVAKALKVSGAAVNKAVKLLCEKGYVYEDGKHLYLTKQGTAYAEAVYEKHCIIKEFLIRNGVSAATAEEAACHMDHLLSEETVEMMRKNLGK